MKTGYYLDLPKIGRTKLTRKFYTEDTKPILLHGEECVPAKTAYIGKLSQELDNFFKQSGGGNMGNLLEICFKNLMYLLKPLGKTQLAAVIGLLVLNYLVKKKKQYGGNSEYIGGMESVLLPMDKSVLLVTAGLLLLQHFLSQKYRKKSEKNNKIKIFENVNVNDVPIFLRGGNDFTNKLIKILDRKYKGGYALYDNIRKTVNPLYGGLNINDKLLYKLDHIFKSSGKERLIDILNKELLSHGLDNYLSTIIMAKKKNKKKKGGVTPDYFNQYGKQYNCGKGDNALEVVGNKALNYGKNYQQFGCEIPEWGYNLFGKNCEKCI